MSRTYYGPELPLTLDDDTGIKNNRTREDAVKQDFLNLLLTNQGERPRHPDFGCGLGQLLFEKNTHEKESEISGLVYTQTSRWMPYLTIEGISFRRDRDDHIGVSISYSSNVLGTSDTIFLSAEGPR